MFAREGTRFDLVQAKQGNTSRMTQYRTVHRNYQLQFIVVSRLDVRHLKLKASANGKHCIEPCKRQAFSQLTYPPDFLKNVQPEKSILSTVRLAGPSTSPQLTDFMSGNDRSHATRRGVKMTDRSLLEFDSNGSWFSLSSDTSWSILI